MDILTIIGILAGLGGGSVAVYLVAVQGVKAAIQKEAKGMALDTVFKQFGLNRQGVKFWNDLDTKGAANLIMVLKTVQQATGTTMGGPFAGAMGKEMANLQQMIAMMQGMRPPVQQNVPQNQPQGPR